MPRSDVLRIAALESRSYVSGPGSRFVIWAQGCSIDCPGCVNGSFADEVGGREVRVDDLAKEIISVRGIEGVTFSGGEPFQQPGVFANLARQVRAAGLSVVSYSGRTLSELRRLADPSVHELLEVVDVLIDGPFLAAQVGKLRWRGSNNQSLQFLSDRYRHLEGRDEERAADLELSVGDHSIRFNGGIDNPLVRIIRSRLREGYGIELS